MENDCLIQLIVFLEYILVAILLNAVYPISRDSRIYLKISIFEAIFAAESRNLKFTAFITVFHYFYNFESFTIFIARQES
jgi:hypothetical protein